MPADVGEINGGPVMSFGVIWIQVERLFELAFRADEVPVINEFEKAKRCVGLAQRLVELQSFAHAMISFRFAPSKGKRPATISYSTTPRLKMSVRASTESPRACSGDM